MICGIGKITPAQQLFYSRLHALFKRRALLDFSAEQLAVISMLQVANEKINPLPDSEFILKIFNNVNSEYKTGISFQAALNRCMMSIAKQDPERYEKLNYDITLGVAHLNYLESKRLMTTVDMIMDDVADSGNSEFFDHYCAMALKLKDMKQRKYIYDAISDRAKSYTSKMEFQKNKNIENLFSDNSLLMDLGIGDTSKSQRSNTFSVQQRIKFFEEKANPSQAAKRIPKTK